MDKDLPKCSKSTSQYPLQNHEVFKTVHVPDYMYLEVVLSHAQDLMGFLTFPADILYQLQGSYPECIEHFTGASVGKLANLCQYLLQKD